MISKPEKHAGYPSLFGRRALPLLPFIAVTYPGSIRAGAVWQPAVEQAGPVRRNRNLCT